MKFKIDKQSTLYSKFQVLGAEIKRCNDAALELAKKYGSDQVATCDNSAAGGIDAIQLDSKPEGFKQRGEKWQMLFYPNARNKEVLKEFQALPKVSFDEMNKLIGFVGGCFTRGSQLAWIRCYGLQFADGEVLISVDNACKFKPVPGMIEILESEFLLLSEKKAEEATQD